MMTNFTRIDFIRKNPLSILKGFIFADMVFIIVHIVNYYTLDTSLFDITADRKLPEIFQYIKYVLVCYLLFQGVGKYRAKNFYAWMILYMYFLLDDSLRIHEKFGKFFYHNFDLPQMFGLAPDVYAELFSSFLAGLIIFPSLIWAYSRGSRFFRTFSHDLILLTGLFVFFGVVVDILASTGYLNNPLWPGVIEDGGEMVVASVLVWHVLRVIQEPAEANLLLCGWQWLGSGRRKD